MMKDLNACLRSKHCNIHLAPMAQTVSEKNHNGFTENLPGFLAEMVLQRDLNKEAVLKPPH